MPWKPEDSLRHNHHANTPARQRQWAHVANGVLERTGDDAKAIEAANAVLRDHPSMKDKPPASRSTLKHGDGLKGKHWSGH